MNTGAALRPALREVVALARALPLEGGGVAVHERLCNLAVEYIADFEEAALPLLQKAGWPVRIDALTTLVELKRDLASLLVFPPGSGHFEPALQCFRQTVLAHEAAMASLWDTLESLGIDPDAESAERPPSTAPVQMPLSFDGAAALVQEAAVVLPLVAAGAGARRPSPSP